MDTVPGRPDLDVPDLDRPDLVGPDLDRPDLDRGAATGCPIVHTAEPEGPASAEACPFPRPSGPRSRVVHRTRADLFVRRLLRIPDRPPTVTPGAAYAAFQKSMIISGIRCTLTYVVFPFIIPLIGIAAGVGPAIGIVIGVAAMICDVFSIRRFFAIDHKYRWYFTIIAGSVILLLGILLVQDIDHLWIDQLS